MSADRYINWAGTKPTKDEIMETLVNFLGGVGTVSFSNGRFIIDLPGSPTAALKGLDPKGPLPASDKRWVEIFMHEDSLDIMTRQGDDFANALAERLADIFAHQWKGERVP
jgi:hypothetical protein